MEQLALNSKTTFLDIKKSLYSVGMIINLVLFFIPKRQEIYRLYLIKKRKKLAYMRLNSNQVFNNLLIYRTSGANIKSVTISINKEGSNDISYAPFALFGGSTFLTGTIGKINNTLKTGDVTIKCNDNDSIQNVKFSNFPQYANAVIIIYYENIKNAIVKEE